jgi:hypothetical protein
MNKIGLLLFLSATISSFTSCMDSQESWEGTPPTETYSSEINPSDYNVAASSLSSAGLSLDSQRSLEDLDPLETLFNEIDQAELQGVIDKKVTEFMAQLADIMSNPKIKLKPLNQYRFPSENATLLTTWQQYKNYKD